MILRGKANHHSPPQIQEGTPLEWNSWGLKKDMISSTSFGIWLGVGVGEKAKQPDGILTICLDSGVLFW